MPEIRLAQDKQSRYYDANRLGDDYDWWNDHSTQVVPYLCLLGDREIPDESEEEVLARNPREARAIMREAIKRDFQEGTLVTKVLLA